jgi:histidine transport system permease protein
MVVYLGLSWYSAVCATAGVLLWDVHAGNSQRYRDAQCIFRSGLNCTLLALTLNTCAYTTEIFAGAIRAVPHGEIEAANAYGFSRFKLYRCIILPSALRTALPAYSNEVILMLHSTALAFTATVPDLLKVARDINSATYQPFTAFGIAAVLYLIISYVLIRLFRKAEKRWMAHVNPTLSH